MPANSRVCAGFRSASRVVSESGRDGSATAVVAAVELLVLSMATAPEASRTNAINSDIIFISTPIVRILRVVPRLWCPSERFPVRLLDWRKDLDVTLLAVAAAES